MIVPGGASEDITITTPGQNAKLSFDGTAGRRVSLKLTNVTAGWSLVSILKPDGTALLNRQWVGGNGYIDTKELPATGTYSLVIDPENANTGNLALTLYDVPPDVGGAIIADGSPRTITIATPGQNARLPFDGGQGQRVSLRLSHT